MIDFENLCGQWENTLKIERGYTFVDTAPLECHIGYDEELRRTLLILCKRKMKIPSSSKTVEINQRKRKDGRFNLSLSLLSENETAVFIEMCRDLLSFTEGAQDESEALKNFWQRYKHWQNLFATAKDDLLSDERQRGLIGELLFLREQITDGRPLKEAVAGWLGPFKEHQDFSYGETWYEIKTISEQAEKVRIPSLEQLSLKTPGELIVYRLGKTSDGFTLNLSKIYRSCLKKILPPRRDLKFCFSKQVTSNAKNTTSNVTGLQMIHALLSMKNSRALRKIIYLRQSSRRLTR